MKMKRTIITAAMSAICICSTAQSNSIAEIMESIEQNNPALNTLRKQTDAQKIENKTGIYLSNPEVEYAYLWGDPSSVGKRHNINVTQTFDFATISGMKNRMADKNNELADISFLSGRQTILLEAQKLCLDVIYCNAMMQGGSEPNGRVRVTKAYNLPSRHIFHTVGPIVRGNVTKNDERDLKNCYLSCLHKAEEMQLNTLAFCCISTGEYGYPRAAACRLACETVRGYLAENRRLKVIFNVFLEEDEKLYASELCRTAG